jgi:very-short-patch-repair endonuclease
METTMNEITQKLLKKNNKHLRPFIEQAQREGMEEGKIIDAVKGYIDTKVREYYNKADLTRIKECFDLAGLQPDSKIEGIFYNELTTNGIKFDFQFPIGPYRADYLINKFLVVELDGPQHEKKRDERRDKYMRQMGYKILRVPTWLLCADSKAVIESIKDIT